MYYVVLAALFLSGLDIASIAIYVGYSKRHHYFRFCGAVLLGPYFLYFFRKLRFRLNALSTPSPLRAASLTAATKSALTSPYKFVTRPGAPARAVRPILCK
jgi:hypothetical protein